MIPMDHPSENPASYRTVVLREPSLKAFEGGFTAIPNRVLENSEISLGARMAYAMLLKYAWQDGFCFPAQQRIATDLGVTDRSVRTFLNELRANHLVDWKHQGLNRPNIYYIERLPSRVVQPRDEAFRSGPEDFSAPDRKEASGQERKQASAYEDSSTRLNTVTGTGISEPDGLTPEEREVHNELLAQEMVEHLGDQESLRLYRRIAQTVPDDLIYRALSETRSQASLGRIRKNRGAYFTATVSRLAARAGIAVDWGRKDFT
jgi:hypothetical protein